MKNVRETLLQTGIDEFLAQVSKKGEVKAADIAKQLDVSLSTIESWAEILAKENLVTTTYDSSGKLLITTTQENVVEKKQLAKDIVNDVDDKVSELHNSFKEKEKTLKQEYTQLKKFEEILKKDLDIVAGLEAELKQLSAMEQDIRKHVTQIVLKEKSAVKDSKTISKLIAQKVKEIEKTEKEINDFNKMKDKLWNDIQVVKRLSWTLRWTSAAKMSFKIKDAEARAKEVKTLSSTLSGKYKTIQKLFSKI